jgi:glucokinase
MAKTSKRYRIGVDLGGTKIQAVVYDDAWKPLARRRRKTKAYLGAEIGLARIRETVESVLNDAKIGVGDVATLGIGAPGPLDPDRGVLLDLPNLGWSNVPLKTELEKAFKCPVAALNDVDAGTYAEYCFGAARKQRCVLGVFPGTGIGGGCVYEGGVVRGKSITAMEIGHLCVLPEGPLCGCGRHGCLETVASRLAIAQAAVAAVYRGEAPHLRDKAGTDLANVRSSALAEAIAKGDTVIESIVRRAARWLGFGIASVVNLLAPDGVVLGGGLVAAMPELYREEVERAARAQVMDAFRDRFNVAVAALGDDATALGAAAWAQQVNDDGKG